MIQLGPMDYLCETRKDLPPARGKEVFLDVETNGLDVWRTDRICGIAVTFDTLPAHWYIPIRHASGNIPVPEVREWLAEVMSIPTWVNHNIKFDAAAIRQEGLTIAPKLVDTIVLAKLHDTDRMNYGLKPLAREWLEMEMSEADEIKAYMKKGQKENFAQIPCDILGRYACRDVDANRRLYRYLQERAYDTKLWDVEADITKFLLEMEERGFVINPMEVKLEQLATMSKIIEIGGKIKKIVGKEYTHSSAWVYDVLINQFGLPILSYHEKTGRPTFNKAAMKKYDLVTKGEQKTAVSLIREIRGEKQYKGLFLEPFLELRDSKNIIRPRYNQMVRTGRWSCADPNIQQQNKRSKLLFHPRPGFFFLSCDYSQIEFRLIAHYAKDQAVLDAYAADPWADFHTVVSALLYGIDIKDVTDELRSGGKTLNFGMAYGMGKKKLIRSLMSADVIIKSVTKELVEFNQEEFERRCEKLALESYGKYHDTMPGIRRISNEAQRMCIRRGYVYNIYGRRRHLPHSMARKAFNSVVQGGAMDLIKRGMLRARKHAIIAANVHDCALFELPLEIAPWVNKEAFTPVFNNIVAELENPEVELRVPIRVNAGISMKTWAEADQKKPVLNSEGIQIGGRIR